MAAIFAHEPSVENAHLKGADITGQAFVELMGYDRSHESVGLVDFLFGGAVKKVSEIFG